VNTSSIRRASLLASDSVSANPANSMKEPNTNSRTIFWVAAIIGGTFLFYFGILLYSECGLPNRSWANIERKRLVQVFFLLVAILLIGTRSFDHRARVGALFLAVTGTAPAFPHEDMRSVWRDLPGFLGALLWIPQIAHFMALPLLFTFYSLLPRSLLTKRWQWVVVWLPAVVLAGWGINGLFQRVYSPGYARDLPRWYIFAVGVCVLLYGFGGLGALAWNYVRLRSPKERRQLAALTFGTIVGWTPGLLFLAAIFLAPFTESPVVWSLVVAPFKHVALAMFALAPVSLLYAILRDRVLDVK
jgi:hypothetical protein